MFVVVLGVLLGTMFSVAVVALTGPLVGLIWGSGILLGGISDVLVLPLGSGAFLCSISFFISTCSDASFAAVSWRLISG